MTPLAVIALFAALHAQMDAAPLFSLPFPAVTNGEVRQAALPQRANHTNTVMRLDGHVMSAMYATTEALFERRLFPAMVNYGPARTASVANLVSADFGGVSSNLQSSAWFPFAAVPDAYASASGRDFSRYGRRIAWPFDLLNGVVYGDCGPAICDTMPLTHHLDETDAAKGERYWLVPEAFIPAASSPIGPSGEWQVNNPLATAGWGNGHLLCLGELDLADIFPNGSPWTLGGFNVITNLIPKWGRDFMDVAQAAQPAVDISLDRLLRDAGTPSGAAYSARGKKLGLGGPDLFWKYTEYSTPHVATSQVTRRFWWERFAFANVALSLCNRTLEGITPAEWRGVEDPPPTAQAPRFRFRRRAYSGGHSASFSLSTSDGFSIVPVGYSSFGVVCDISKFTDNGDFSATNYIFSAATSRTEAVSAVWTETAPTASASSTSINAFLTFSAYPGVVNANPEANFEDYEWNVKFTYDGFYGGSATFSVWVNGSSGSSDVAPFEGGLYEAYAGSLSFDSVESLPGTLDFSIMSGFAGIEALDGVMGMRGPTPLESASVTNEAEWTIAPAPRAAFLWDESIVNSVDVAKFVSVLVSTNENIIASIFADKTPDLSAYGATLLRDSWLFTKYSTVSKGILSYSQYVQSYLSFHSIVDDLTAVAAANPGSNLPPTAEAAANLPIDGTKQRARSVLGSSGCVTNVVKIVEYTAPQSSFSVRKDPGSETLWYLDIPVMDAFAPKFGFGTGTKSVPARKSAAYLYEANPVIITEWNFPLMRDDGE